MRHNLAVLDEDGLIITVNTAWRQFADDNGLTWGDYGVGRNYLEVCEFAKGDNAIEADAALIGIHGVMTNKHKDWSLVYPCHSPFERRLFFMYVFRYENNGDFRTAVIHMNITGREIDKEKLLNSLDTHKLKIGKNKITGI